VERKEKNISLELVNSKPNITVKKKS